ncbi:MAG: hypothetical protein R2879_07405 [Saprospiraceae bacterium]
MKTSIYTATFISLLLLVSCRPEEPMEQSIDNSSITNVFDQSGFKKLDVQGQGSDFEVIPIRNGGYLFIGKNTYNNIKALQFDEDLNFVKRSSSSTNDYLNNPRVIENSSGDFLITSVSELDDKNISSIKKLNGNLNLVWDNPINSEKSLSLTDLIETNEGTYIVAGKTSDKSNSFTSDFYIAKLNDLGEVKNETSIDLDFSDTPFFLKKLNEEKILFLGSTGGGPDEIFQAILIDTSGNFDSNTEMTVKSSIVFQSSIETTEDNGFLLLTNNILENGAAKDVILVKLDKDYQYQWSKEFGGKNIEEVVKILRSPNGGYFIILNTRSYGSGGKDIYLAKINTEGDILWSNTYGSISDEIAENAFLINDRLVLYCTTKISTNSNQKDHNMLILDLDGNPI